MTETKICYVTGDATRLQHDDSFVHVLAHVVNNVGAFGAGIARTIAQRWPRAAVRYRRWYNGEISDSPFDLGRVQYVTTPDGPWVAHMLAQRGLRSARNPCPLDYKALRGCLADVASFAVESRASVHMPRIGCGYAGGSWNRVEPLIRATLCARGVAVTVYDLPDSESPHVRGGT